jgi:hypothetical protein
MRVDVHQHLWTEPLVSVLAGRREPPYVERRDGEWILHTWEPTPWPLPAASEDVDARAALVRADGLDLALIALSSPLGIEALPPAEAQPLLDAYHAGLAGLPPCFGGWGAVGLADPDPAAVEAALDRGLVGVSLPAGALASVAGVERCGPMLERLQDRDAPLFVHPGPAPWSAPAEGLDGAPAWWPALTTYVSQMSAAWHAFLAVGRPNHPRLRVGFAMLAGAAPLHLERLIIRGGPGDRALDALLFYDTSSYGGRAVDAMVRCVGIEQLVHGSDRPVVEPALGPLGDAAADATILENGAKLVGSPRGVRP